MFRLNVRILTDTTQRRVHQQVANSARNPLPKHHVAGPARPLLQSTFKLRVRNVSRTVFVGGASVGKESALDPSCGPVQGPDQSKVSRLGGEPTETTTGPVVSRSIVAS